MPLRPEHAEPIHDRAVFDKRGDTIGLVRCELHRAEPQKYDHESPSKQAKIPPTVLGDKKFITVENAHLKFLNSGPVGTSRTSSTCFGQALQYMRDAYTIY
ncbi:hypothetical protein SPRA44_640118 [Serratia proteamaculans]|nr:hypothetical protein SPRA44_640118 [Serratia proteamaculans]